MMLRVLGGAAVVLAVCTSGGCDTAKLKEQEEKVAALQDKVTALEARVKDMEDKWPVQYSKPDKDDEYVTAVAGAMIDALLAADVSGIRNNLSPSLKQAIDAKITVDPFYGTKSDEVAKWVTAWNPNGAYKAYTIEKVVLSPTKDEAVIQGNLTPKNDAAKKGSFSITLVKDKEKSKFLIGASSAKP
jgi:hypothetical protein